MASLFDQVTAKNNATTAFQKKWGKQIVQEDKSSKGFDINPIVKIPIRGV